MKLAVALIYCKPVKPTYYIVDLEPDVWKQFLWGGTKLRICIVCRSLGMDNLSHYIREIAWFPINGQNLKVPFDSNCMNVKAEISPEFHLNSEQLRLFFLSIDLNDSIWFNDNPEQIFQTGDQRITFICQGHTLSIMYKYTGTQKQYNFWLGDDSKIHVQVISPTGKVRNPDLYNTDECKQALLLGKII